MTEEHAEKDRGKWYLKMKFKILLQIKHLIFDILSARVCVCARGRERTPQNTVPRIQKILIPLVAGHMLAGKAPNNSLDFFNTVIKTMMMIPAIS